MHLSLPSSNSDTDIFFQTSFVSHFGAFLIQQVPSLKSNGFVLPQTEPAYDLIRDGDVLTLEWQDTSTSDWADFVCILMVSNWACQ